MNRRKKDQIVAMFSEVVEGKPTGTLYIYLSLSYYFYYYYRYYFIIIYFFFFLLLFYCSLVIYIMYMLDSFGIRNRSFRVGNLYDPLCLGILASETYASGQAKAGRTHEKWPSVGLNT